MSRPAGDPYLDPACGVLRNLLGITDAAELARAEAALSASRLIDLERRRLPGRYDLAHLQAFHRYILGDVYGWAGSKGLRMLLEAEPDLRVAGEAADGSEALAQAAWLPGCRRVRACGRPSR